MPESKFDKRYSFDKPGNYRIRIQGILDKSWSGRLGGLRVTACDSDKKEGPVTELCGKMRDQAELSGVLNTLYELHLTLISVEMLENGY